MLRSLFAGISGLRSNQVMLDVTGNNIANANTIGFKSSGTVFQDTLSQMLTGAAAPDAANGRGGTNPMQIGLGVQVAAITTNFNQGSSQVTGRATDLMIQGDGFFIVNKGGQELYTRAGSFNFDNEGSLVTPDGAYVQGYTYDSATNAIPDPAATPAAYNRINLVDIQAELVTGGVLSADDELKSYTIGADGTVTGVFVNQLTGASQLVPMARLSLADFNNPAGLEKVGNTTYRQ